VRSSIACASASCARDRPAASNQSPHPRNYEHDPFIFARPARPAVAPSRWHFRAARTRLGILGRTPLLRFRVPCNARWRRSRYPGRPASGRSRFGVSSSPAGPRTPCLLGTTNLSDVRCFVHRPCGFPLSSGFVAMKLAWRTRFGVRAFQPNPSLARRVEPNGPRVRPCRRVDDLLLCH